MGRREYVGAGGTHIHLDDPLSPEMAKQVARGHLVPVDDSPATPAPETPAHAPSGADVKRPAANAKVADWQAYAAALGMDAAGDATKQECQDYVQVIEDAQSDTAGQE